MMHPICRIAAIALMSGILIGNAAAADAAARADHSHAQTAQKKKRGVSAETPFGREGDPRKAKRVIKVDMSDTMRFFPSEVRVKRGDTVRFNVTNSGQLPHEMVIGTMDDLKKHAEMMRKEHAEMAHEESYIAHVEPGGSGRIVWQFTRPGEFYYACLIPGHFEAGMIGTIVVR